MYGDTLLFALRKHLLSRHLDFLFIFSEEKKLKLVKLGPMGKGLCVVEFDLLG